MDISFPEIEKFDRLPDPRVDGVRAFASITEGCSKYCTFCVVPYTRGEEFSRPFDDVIAEVVHLAEHGVREVVLLGQNVNAYLETFGLKRMLLHAHSLSFTWPDTGEPFSASSPLPDDLRAVLTALEVKKRAAPRGRGRGA